MGGVVPAIEKGFFQREIGNAAKRYQSEIDKRKRIIVGVNAHTLKKEPPLSLLRIGPDIERKQIRRLKQVRKSRSSKKVKRSLEGIRRAAVNGQNLMESLIEAAHAYVSLGEIIQELKGAFGEHRQKPLF
jgi:methylmalonyl-CoA mutase N-terminal domain/subunit